MAMIRTVHVLCCFYNPRIAISVKTRKSILAGHSYSMIPSWVHNLQKKHWPLREPICLAWTLKNTSRTSQWRVKWCKLLWPINYILSMEVEPLVRSGSLFQMILSLSIHLSQINILQDLESNNLIFLRPLLLEKLAFLSSYGRGNENGDSFCTGIPTSGVIHEN